MKNNSYITILLLLLLILCCGCAKETVSAPTEMAAATSAIVPTAAPTMEIETDPSEIRIPQITEAAAETPDYLNMESGAHQLRYESENLEEYMDYYLFIPKNPVENMPIVVFLHGSVEIGHVELLENYGIVSVVKDLYAEDFPFLLLLPNTHKPSWTGNEVPETVIGLIDEVAETYRADRDRICITGHSLGSVGTWKMISLYGDYFSAAVPISCGIDEPMNYENCAKVSIVAYAGTVGADEKNYNPAMHKLVDTINAAGGNARMEVIGGADHEAMVTAAYTRELFDWILAQ